MTSHLGAGQSSKGVMVKAELQMNMIVGLSSACVVNDHLDVPTWLRLLESTLDLSSYSYRSFDVL